MTCPVGLIVKNKKCLIVGGGRIALRKTLSLLEADASVTIVSPEFLQGIVTLQTRYQDRLNHGLHPFDDGRARAESQGKWI